MSDTTEDLMERTPREIRTPLRDPKNQIRLLYLEAGSDEDDIFASLEIWDKEDAPSYNAISYVCGTMECPRTITVNGEPFLVGQNCHYALWQARLHYPQSYIWIDAICINQENLTEKMSQVSMMGEIYAVAWRVLASIGPADEYSEIVRMATLNVDAYLQSVRTAIFTQGTKYRNTGIKGLNMSLWHPPMDVASTVQFCNDFETFSQRPYFGRAWIVQELAGGKYRTTILCGQETMDWKAVKEVSWRSVGVLEVLNIGRMLPPHQPDRDNRIGTLHLLIAGRSRYHYPIKIYLAGMLNMLCQDVRDRIFGTLTLLDWSRFGHLPPVPDYRLTPLEVGLQLLDKVNELDFFTVALIAKNLELPHDPELSLTQLSESLINVECSSAANRSRRWYTHAPELFIVRQDPAGRMQIDVQCRPELDTKLPMARRPLETSQETLSAHGLTRIFAGEQACALASVRTLDGDILVLDESSQFLLRPCNNESGFVVIGAVYMSLSCQRMPKNSSPGECACWQRSEVDEYEYEPVKIAMDLTNAQVLTAVICHEAVKLGAYDALTYLGRDALGTVKANACAWDITAAGWESHRVIGPRNSVCDLHKACDHLRKARNAVGYSALLEAGGSLWVTK